MDARTAEIVDRFNTSWIDTEARFEFLIDLGPEMNLLIPIYTFIRKLKSAGEDKYFRLGTSMHDLLISRSVEPRLRLNQKYIQIEALDRTFVVTLRNGNKMYRQYTIKDLDDERLKGLLQTLKSTLVD